MPTFHQELNEFLAAWEPLIQLQHTEPITPAQSPESLSPLLQEAHPQYEFVSVNQQQQLPHGFTDLLPSFSGDIISLPPIAAAVQCTPRVPYLPQILPPIQQVSKFSHSILHPDPYVASLVASPPSPATYDRHRMIGTPQNKCQRGRYTIAHASSASLQECGNCRTRETSAWRKDEHGRVLCNACGLYRKQRGHDRPAAFPFRKSAVRRRNRGDRKPADPVTALVRNVPQALALDGTL